jgi:hypothetical protein
MAKRTLELHYSPIKPQIIIEKYLGDVDSLPSNTKSTFLRCIAKSMYVVSGRGRTFRYTITISIDAF